MLCDGGGPRVLGGWGAGPGTRGVCRHCNLGESLPPPPDRCPDTGQAVRGPLGGEGVPGTVWGKHGPPPAHSHILGWVSSSTWEVLVFAAVETNQGRPGPPGRRLRTHSSLQPQGRGQAQPHGAETQRQAEERELRVGKGRSGSAGHPERPRAPGSRTGLARRVVLTTGSGADLASQGGS